MTVGNYKMLLMSCQSCFVIYNFLLSFVELVFPPPLKGGVGVVFLLITNNFKNLNQR